MLQMGGISKTKTVLQSPETIEGRLRQQTFNIEMAPVHTGPGAHPASYTMGTRSFPGVKRLGHGTPHLMPRLKEEYSYICSPSPSWPVLGWTLPLPSLPIWAGRLNERNTVQITNLICTASNCYIVYIKNVVYRGTSTYAHIHTPTHKVQ
jgi:hypothetical protein